MKDDKFLIGIVAGIVLLVVVALVAVLTRSPGQESYRPGNAPEDVVHNYFLALQRKDYEKAYGYLSDELRTKPTLNQFIRDIDNAGRSEASLQIRETRLGNATAQVDVSITRYAPGGLFESGNYTSQDTVHLRATGDGSAWKLIGFPYPYWGFNWDEPDVRRD